MLLASSGGGAGVFFLLVFVGCGFAWWKLRSGEALRFETTAAPQQVVMTAVSVVGTKRRWAVLAQTDNGVTFSYHKGPNKFLAFVLFLFFIVPCILYLILAGKKESLAVQVHQQGNQMMVQATSNGWRGKSAGRALRAQLGLAPGTAASVQATLA
jgi:hypothetical protein